MKRAALILGVLVSIGIVGARAHAAQVYDLIDPTTNQPTLLTDNEGTNWGIFPSPTGFTCAADFTTHCEATVATSIGDNLMKRFLASNSTGPMATGTYTLVLEQGTQCGIGESLSTCEGHAGNDWQDFSIPYVPPASTSTQPFDIKFPTDFTSECLTQSNASGTLTGCYEPWKFQLYNIIDMGEFFFACWLLYMAKNKYIHKDKK